MSITVHHQPNPAVPAKKESPECCWVEAVRYSILSTDHPYVEINYGTDPCPVHLGRPLDDSGCRYLGTCTSSHYGVYCTAEPRLVVSPVGGIPFVREME